MKKESIVYKRFLPLYQSEMYRLLGDKHITMDDLVPLDRSREISGIRIADNASVFSFNYKNETKDIELFFDNFQQKVGDDSLSYCYTYYSQYCGAFSVYTQRLLVKFENIIKLRSSIVSLISYDLKNELIIDFYYEDAILKLDIEVKGNFWKNCAVLA